ncbi:B3 DNA binding domain-containing protein [Tanacetum coccineum]
MRGPPSKCISPSCFFKFIKTALNSQLSIPISYQKYLVSRRKNKTAILKRVCRKWHVKIDNDWVFGEGWEAFGRDNGVQDFDFVVFKHQGNMVFDTMVFDTSSCKREYPIHKAKRACLEKNHMGNVKPTLMKTPKVKDTYINISLKSEKSIIPDHNNHPYFIGTLKASSKKLRVGLYSEDFALDDRNRWTLQNSLSVKRERDWKGFWPNIRNGGFIVGPSVVNKIKDPRVCLDHRCLTTTILARSFSNKRIMISLLNLLRVVTPPNRVSSE